MSEAVSPSRNSPRSESGPAVTLSGRSTQTSISTEGWGEDIDRPGLQIFDKNLWHDTQSDLLIDPTEAQIVNLTTERRNVFTLCGVDVERDNICAGWGRMLRDFEGRGVYPPR